MAVFPSRVIPLSEGQSAYQFTMLKNNSTPEEVFSEQFESLKRELSGLESKID